MSTVARPVERTPLAQSRLELMLGTGLATALAPINSTMVAVALPDIRSQFHVGVGALTWLISLYLIVVAVSQPIAGRLGDAAGHRRVIVVGLAVLTIFSVLAALSWSYPALVVTRALQGVAAALIMPNVLAYLRRCVPAERLGSVLGLNGAAVSTGAASGPLVGGLLLAVGDWRLLFLVNVPLALVSLLLVLRLSPDAGAGRQALTLDGVSLSALAGCFTGMALLGSAFRLHNSALTAASVALLPISIALYLARYRRQRSGVVDLRLFARRGFWTAAGGVALSNLVMYTTLIAMPIFLTDRRGLSEAAVGGLLFAMSFAIALMSPPAGALVDRIGVRPLMLAGAVTLLAATAALTALLDAPVAALVVLLLALGAGMGVCTSAQQASALSAWPPVLAGSASGTFSMMRYVGSVTGAAVIAAVLGAAPQTRDFRLLFAAVAAFAAACVVVSRFAPVRGQGIGDRGQ
jgi:MFS family permease